MEFPRKDSNSEDDIPEYRNHSLSDADVYDREASAAEYRHRRGSYRRSRSLECFELNDYSLGEIRRLHERLAARNPGLDNEKRTSFRDFTRPQVLVLACLCLVNFISFCSMSILAPFFPKEASEKQMSASTSGLVFSFYAFVIFIFSPIFGKVIPTIGAKFVFTSGLFIAGGCNLLFGALEFIQEPWLFATYCFILRGFEALGAAAYSTATYVFVVEVFPTNVGAVLGFMETFVGLGMSMGPAIGGLLYSLHGFELPFYTLGVVLILTVPMSLFLLPSIKDNTIGKKGGPSMFILLTNHTVLLIGAVIVVISIIWSFLDPTLEPHLRQFSMTPEKIGLVFLLFSGIYGISSPFWGWVADLTRTPWLLMSLGLFFSSVALYLLGPAPFLPFIPSSSWVDILALSILGASVSLGLLPTFQGILDAARDKGYRRDTATYSLVAGTWSSLYALGEVIGPLAGGILTEQYNFAICCTVVATISICLSIFCGIAYFFIPSISGKTSCSLSSSDSGYSRSSQDDFGEFKPLLESGKSF